MYKVKNFRLIFVSFFDTFFSTSGDLRVPCPWKKKRNNFSVRKSPRPYSILSFSRSPDPHSSLLTLGRVPVVNVLHNVMTSSRPHLHRPKHYMMCCKGVDPRRELPSAPAGLLYNVVDVASFDKTFAEDANALNKLDNNSRAFKHWDGLFIPCCPLLEEKISLVHQKVSFV